MFLYRIALLNNDMEIQNCRFLDSLKYFPDAQEPSTVGGQQEVLDDLHIRQAADRHLWTQVFAVDGVQVKATVILNWKQNKKQLTH